MALLLQLKSLVPELHPVLFHAIRIAVILGVAYIATKLVVRTVPRIRKRIVNRMTRNGSNVSSKSAPQPSEASFARA